MLPDVVDLTHPCNGKFFRQAVGPNWSSSRSLICLVLGTVPHDRRRWMGWLSQYSLPSSFTSIKFQNSIIKCQMLNMMRLDRNVFIELRKVQLSSLLNGSWTENLLGNSPWVLKAMFEAQYIIKQSRRSNAYTKITWNMILFYFRWIFILKQRS